MVVSSTAMVPTGNSSRYLQQLCKHWAHNLAVDFTSARGTVKFTRDARGADWPADALVTMIAHADSLECRIDASVVAQRDGLKGALGVISTGLHSMKRRSRSTGSTPRGLRRSNPRLVVMLLREHIDWMRTVVGKAARCIRVV